MIKYYVQALLTGTGHLFLDAEAELLLHGQDAIPFLQEQQKDADSFTNQVIQVMLQRIDGNQIFQAVLDFFEETEQRTAPTVMGAPTPEWVAGKLFQDFGSQAAALLGVYLNKLAPIWANWKIMGVILYLGQISSTASADALLRFVTTTASEHYRKFALQSLVAIGDANTLSKIESELKSLDASRTLLEQAAEQIRNKLEKIGPNKVNGTPS